ncbi:beta-hydroxyacyl-(acyl-carrier-protein) dehydratase [Oleiphilus messinensis]|uniref:Beta-hydroxyacyl-(Acyl-carrier-protein) dehydratase n=1 Tax=Oleiphilus messinensis TaxID=141451 RepID=A0A1Y0I5N4_9GAMM|nr:hypothetical protein [Oleiphilus messinensis]ARU55106.1 beta-hydroxyacyl-(acyl-carrier-protein) dehydratase [Oleiphilus messinensis]
MTLTPAFPPIEALLAHRPPMILIDSLLSADQDQALSLTCIQADNLFFDHDSRWLPSYIGIELMAQTIGAWKGFQNLKNQHPIQIGFLLGTRKFSAEVNGFLEHETLITRVSRLYEEESGLCVFDCEIYTINRSQLENRELDLANLPQISSTIAKALANAGQFFSKCEALVAEAKINVYQPQDTEAYLKGLE